MQKEKMTALEEVLEAYQPLQILENLDILQQAYVQSMYLQALPIDPAVNDTYQLIRRFFANLQGIGEKPNDPPLPLSH